VLPLAFVLGYLFPSTTDFRHLKSNIQVSVVGYGGGQKKDQALFGSHFPSTTDFRHLKSNIQVSVAGYGGGQKKDQALFWLPPYGYGCALMSPHPKFPPAPVVFYIGSITRSSAASGLAVGLLSSRVSVLSASDVDD